MLIKRIRTKTRPSTDISWEWADDSNSALAEINALQQSMIESGLIHFITGSSSEDGLTHTQEMHFTSIENYVNYEKQYIDLSYNNGEFFNSCKYLLDNGITHTASYIFEN